MCARKRRKSIFFCAERKFNRTKKTRYTVFFRHAFVRMRGSRASMKAEAARGATPSLPCERLSYASARLEGGGHDDQPACRGSQNNSDKQGGGGEAETSCAGLHARPKDWAFQNQRAHLDSMLFTARGISAHFAYTSGMNNYSSKYLPKLTQYS